MESSSMTFLLLSACALLFSPYVTAKSCNVPSQFWCDSPDVALACGVYEQCERHEWTLRKDAETVKFGLYFESLCPGCKQFITYMLFPTFQKLQSIMDLTLVPYGNAEEKQVDNHWEFTCQHGGLECQGNIIETCTINIVKNISVYFPFINCIEASEADPKSAAEECAKTFPVPLQEILNCSTSDYGSNLEHQMALLTDSLSPAHTYVPWVTLNGVHTEAIENAAMDNLVKLICDTYKGTPKPAACSQK